MAPGRRRGRAIILIALILILLVVAVFVMAQFGSGLPGITSTTPDEPAVAEFTPTPQPDSVDIIVTSQEIRRGQEITDDRITTLKIPQRDYTEGIFFQSRDELVGARALYDMQPHTPLTRALVVPVGVTASLPAFEIPRGMVAISIPISRLSAISYGLQKGDHVNVLASLLMVDLDTTWQSRLPNRTGYVLAPGPIEGENITITSITSRNFMPPEYSATGGEAFSYMGRIEIDPTSNNPMWVMPGETQRPRLISQTLIQDVVVLQMGNFNQQQTPQPEGPVVDEVTTPGQEVPTPVQPEAPNVVTLIVSPQDAVTLNYLMLAGANLNMVLRSAGDDQRVDTEAVTLQFILDQYRIPNPAKLPYGLEPRVDRFPEYVSPFPQPGPSPTPLP
jgi:Flp pilus assembly protein CpaB